MIVRDEQAAIGEKVDDEELVRTTLNGFQKQSDVFVQVVTRRSNFPTQECLWNDFTQEELLLSLMRGNSCTSSGSKQKGGDNKNVALVRKDKAKKGFNKGSNSKEEKKKDMSKIKCYGCHKFGHYRNNCPLKKNADKKGKKQTTIIANELSRRIEDEFALIACSNNPGELWHSEMGHGVLKVTGVPEAREDQV